MDINANKSEKPDRSLIEGFPASLLTQIYKFYQKLQNKKIALDKDKANTSIKSPKTKTQYAYEYKK